MNMNRLLSLILIFVFYFGCSAENDMLDRQETHADRGSSISRIEPSTYTVMSDSNGTVRPFVNNLLNSQVTHDLNAGPWEIGWRTELNDVQASDFVLHVGNQIIVQGNGRWQLFTSAGEHLARENYGASDIVIDTEEELFYLADIFGRFNALNLKDGSKQYIALLEGTNDNRRTYIARREKHVFATSFAQPNNPHPESAFTPLAIAEVVNLGDLNHVESHILMQADQEFREEFESTTILGVLFNETVILAVQDHILIGNLSLEWDYEYAGEFIPLAMSVSEEGIIYVIVKEADGNSLLEISQSGKLMRKIEVPEVPLDGYKPPILGPDGTIYLILNNRVKALSIRGESWEYSFDKAITGAIVSANNHLMLTVGPYLLSFTSKGDRDAIMMLESGTWTSPPTLTEKGDILALSQDHLYSLQIKDK